MASSRRIACGAVLLLAARLAGAQLLSNLERERPVSIEDARPVPYRALSGSADWSYTLRTGSLNDYGPGFSVLYGAVRGLEVGAAMRWVTRPERNANRGIASGDLMIHALYQLSEETSSMPAFSGRIGVQFPTGLDSKGTDVELSGLATRSFDSFRAHVNLRYTRLGATVVTERAERVEAVGGIDFVPGARGLTNTLVIADAAVRSNPVVGGSAIVAAELGMRHRIGSQTFLFGGAGSELTGRHDRARLRLSVGLTHFY